MPYDPVLVQPMRDDLTRLGFEELYSAEDVDRVVKESKGTLLVVVNSVCGCAAGTPAGVWTGTSCVWARTSDSSARSADTRC